MPLLNLFTHYLLPFIAVIGPVIVIHELGHFLAAKSVGIRVERFSIGFPPRMVGKKIGETDYCLSWVPLGGYVKMAGMIDESLDRPESITGAPDEFMSKNSGQKVLVITAGVIMNMIMAMVLLSAVALFEGVPVIKDPLVEVVSPGMPAEKAGILPGDRITSINGSPIETWDQMLGVIHGSAGKPVQITWEHEGASKQAELIPEAKRIPIDGKMQEVGLIGISPRPTYFRRTGFFEALGSGAVMTYSYLKLGASSIGMLVSGRASIKELGGPIQIAKWSGEWARGGLAAFLSWIALISVNIGMLNILPVPALDGGHLVLILIEAVRRKPITTRIKVAVQQVGMVLLLVLMVMVIWNDAGRVGLLGKLKGMF